MRSIYEIANPQRFTAIANVMVPVLGWASLLLIGAGLFFALFNSPADYQQGQSVRIMYVHVPAAWLALLCYTSMTIASVVGFAWKHPLADLAARLTAPIGAVFTFLALVTGSLWGKPMWGTWWAWDARLTSVLILFFLYLGYIAIWEAIDDKQRAAKLAAITCIVGFINIPIIKFSVDWWNSLHQPASIIRADGPSIDQSMLTPLLLMGTGYMTLFGWLLFLAMSTEIRAKKLDRLKQADQRPVSKVQVL